MTDPYITFLYAGGLLTLGGVLALLRVRYKTAKWLRVTGVHIGNRNEPWGLDNERVHYAQLFSYRIGDETIEGIERSDGNGLVVGKEYALLVDPARKTECQVHSWVRQYLLVIIGLGCGCPLLLLYWFGERLS